MMLTANFGVAHSSSPHSRIEALIQQADSHLYRAKALGRNEEANSSAEALLPSTP